MTEDDEKKPNEQGSGSGGGTGESVRPSSGSPEELHFEREGPVREIPIGIPMDPEEFRRRKAQAERPSSQEAEGQAQADEDASTTRED